MSSFYYRELALCNILRRTLGCVALGIALVLTAGCINVQHDYKDYGTIDRSENPTVYPVHTYTVNATSAEDIDALNDAAGAAVNFCANSNLDAKILSRAITYQGMTDTEKDIANNASTLFNKFTAPTRTNRDYRLTVKFVCVKPVKKVL